MVDLMTDRTQWQDRITRMSREWVIASDPDRPIRERKEAFTSIQWMRSGQRPVQLADAGIPYDRFAELKQQLESSRTYRPGSLMVFVIVVAVFVGIGATVAIMKTALK